MKGRKLLAAALLAGMVSSPVVMAEVLSDDALGEVSAQGLQIAVQTGGGAVQNLNNDAVQLNDNTQQNAQGMTVTNASASAANAAQNVAGVVGSTSRGRMTQSNNQYADNSEDSRQYTYQEDVDFALGGLWLLYNVQNANNGAAQLNGNAQENVQGMIITNAASSAVNAAQNVAGLVDSQDDGTDNAAIVQRNTQVAQNSGLNAQYPEQIDVDVNVYAASFDFDRQNINNGSTQLNANAQASAQGMLMTNAASSAVNAAQNVAGVVRSDVDDILQSNDQYASNTRVNGQLSGQGEGDGQLYAVSIDLDRQSVNNGSAQLNDNAQAAAVGLAITNVASSAVNVAQNVAGLLGADTAGVPNDLVQASKQVAVNMAVNGQGSAQVDYDLNIRGFAVNIDEQNTNDGSVQLNDNAQADVTGLSVANVASSALNVGQNIAGIIDSSGANVRQTNNQYAEDGSVNAQYAVQLHAGGLTLNLGVVNTNSGSVQLNGNAQANAVGMALTNAASSAVNVGQNVLGMVNGYTGTITQVNVQSAVNY